MQQFVEILVSVFEDEILLDSLAILVDDHCLMLVFGHVDTTVIHKNSFGCSISLSEAPLILNETLSLVRNAQHDYNLLIRGLS